MEKHLIVALVKSTYQDPYGKPPASGMGDNSCSSTTGSRLCATVDICPFKRRIVVAGNPQGTVGGDSRKLEPLFRDNC